MLFQMGLQKYTEIFDLAIEELEREKAEKERRAEAKRMLAGKY